MTATAEPLRRALAANSTAAAYPTSVPVAVKPSGAGIFDLYDKDLGINHRAGNSLQRYVLLIPYGSDAANETFNLQLMGWSRVEDSALAPLWVPQLLGLFAVTLGAGTATALGASNFLADTIVITKGAADGGYNSLISGANDTPASILVDVRGCEILQFGFDIGDSGAASANCLWRMVDDK